jgi:hypothetical protein
MDVFIKSFNWIGFVAAIGLALSSSLLLSLNDGEIDAIEILRAVLQAIIAGLAFIVPPQIVIGVKKDESKKRVS